MLVWWRGLSKYRDLYGSYILLVGVILSILSHPELQCVAVITTENIAEYCLEDINTVTDTNLGEILHNLVVE